MIIHLNTQADLEEAIHALVKQDPRLRPILELAGMPALRRREPGYAGLARQIEIQQRRISVAKMQITVRAGRKAEDGRH